MNPSKYARGSDEQVICELVQLALDNQLDEQQRRQLNELLRKSRALRACYLECLAVQVAMKRLTPLIENGFPQNDLRNFDPMLWKAMAEDERTAEAIDLSPEPQPRPLIRKVQRQKVTHRISKFPWAVAITSLAALIMMITYVMLNPRPYEKATAVITDMVDARWTHTENLPRIGQTIYNTTYDLYLAAGVVKLRFDSGAEILVEGPSVFSCETSESMRLKSGKVYAIVCPAAIGFTVTTPTCDIIDLGTQFGIAVQPDGSSTVQMYEGKASLIGGAQGQPLQTMTLKRHEARFVDASTGSITPVEFAPLAFIRHVDSGKKTTWNGRPLDLADIVGGGNGFGTGKPGAGIDPKTGQFNAPYIRYGRMYIAKEAFWSPVPANPFVDCVFVTDGSKGPQRVTTQGHYFDNFEPTDRRFHHDIFYAASAASTLPNDDDSEDQIAAVSQTAEITLDGVRYGTLERPAILMHAPLGITFDLAAINQSLSGLKIQRFQSIVGIPDVGREGALLDVMVLLDGVCVFRHDHYAVADTSLVLDIPIAPENRFLTLAVTDGGNGSWWDLCVFGQPRLELTNN